MPGDSKRVICILVATFSYMEQESVEGEDILKHTRGLNKIEICSYFTIKPYILDTCSSRELLHHGRRAGIEKTTQIRVVSGETTFIVHV